MSSGPDLEIGDVVSLSGSTYMILSEPLNVPRTGRNVILVQYARHGRVQMLHIDSKYIQKRMWSPSTLFL